jgi:hypothetical protein
MAKTVKVIIDLIETLEPSNNAEMAIIDAQVWHYLYGDDVTPPAGQYPQYTRSRDVLKTIRPAEFLVKIENWEKFTAVYGCFILPDGTLADFDSGQGTTEELAELHVILQGIAYSRK